MKVFVCELKVEIEEVLVCVHLFPLTPPLSQGRLHAVETHFVQLLFQQLLMCVGVTVHQNLRCLQLNVAQSSSLFHVRA